jgi:hypothetical protein
VPVDFNMYLGNSKYNKELLPVLFFLNGANVEAKHYSQVSVLPGDMYCFGATVNFSGHLGR